MEMRGTMFYRGTITALRAAIEEHYPGTQAACSEIIEGQLAPLPYLLWMCDEVGRMDTTSIDEALKAARWMGWVFAYIELHSVWNNTMTRNHVRADHEAGFDKPHHD